MTTRSRIRKGIDYGRLADAVRMPGIDVRCWVTTARVDNDPDAIRWTEDNGWVVDVTFTSGELAGEPAVPCRVATDFAGNQQAIIQPIEPDCEVIVILAGGDPNNSPIIVGQLHNGGGCEPPEEVNGQTIDEEFAQNTHIMRTPHAIETQAGGDIRVATPDGTHRIVGDQVRLADSNAGQAYVRGDDYADALNDFLGVFQAFLSTLTMSTPAPPNGALTVADLILAVNPPGGTSLIQATADLRAARAQYLSDRIKGE